LSTNAIYHWFVTLPLPFWVWIFTRNHQFPERVLPLSLVALAWFMVLVSYWLKFAANDCRRPWRLIGLIVSVTAPLIASLTVSDGYTPGITLVAVGILYFVDTLASRQSTGFYPAGLTTAWGLWLILNHAQIDHEVITLALSFLVAIYIL